MTNTLKLSTALIALTAFASPALAQEEPAPAANTDQSQQEEGGETAHAPQSALRRCRYVRAAASCPQAASMSRPRVSRTVTGTPLPSSAARKAAIAPRLEPSKPLPVGL